MDQIKRLSRFGWVVVLGLSCVPLSHATPTSEALGLEPVYPQLNPDRTQLLDADEIEAALAELPGWQVRDGFLFKVFTMANFRDAVALIVRISYPLDRLDHHPEIRNIYGKVYVGFTTYDQGQQVTAEDVAAAHAVEAALRSPAVGADSH